MRRMTFGAALAATMALAACSKDSPTEPTELDDDYSLVLFGSSGNALENTMGAQPGGRPFDGRTGAPRLPEELQLSAEQLAAIEALRTAFKAAHQSELDALRAIFEEARAAREAGATRAEVHAILVEGRGIGQGLREDVHELHDAILDVLTDEQQAWLDARRRAPPRDLDGRRHPPHRGRR